MRQVANWWGRRRICSQFQEDNGGRTGQGGSGTGQWRDVEHGREGFLRRMRLDGPDLGESMATAYLSAARGKDPVPAMER